MLEGIALVWLPYLRLGGCSASRQIDDRLSSLTGEVGGDHQQHVIVRRPDIRDPLGRHAVAEQISLREVGERPLGLRRGRKFRWDMQWDLDLANGFADLDDLGSTSDGMGFDLAARGPVVGGIVMVDVAEHHAALNTMEDQPDIATSPGRPEVLVLDVVEPVALQARVGRVDLEIKSGELGRFLLITAEFVQAGLKAVGEEESHQGEDDRGCEQMPCRLGRSCIVSWGAISDLDAR